MRIDGSGQANVTNDPGFSDIYPAWSPDGTKIAFTTNRTGNREVFVMNADGSDPVNLTNWVASADIGASWSPDGTQIAFTSHRSGNDDIWVMGADGSNPVNLTPPWAASDTRPSWSPDGTQIAFTSQRSGSDDIWVMGADGSNPVNLTPTSAASDTRPAWSPDGTKIAFTSDRTEGQNDVYLMNADGSGQINLTNRVDRSDSDPVFSPDGGTRIAYTADAAGISQVHSLNLTPSGGTYGRPANLTHDATGASTPSWQGLSAQAAQVTPIQHIVLIMMENHSFDNVLGYLCVVDIRCDGTTEGQKSDGSIIPLTESPDVSPEVDHSPTGQHTAINGGKMNGFDKLDGCHDYQNNACYVQYYPQDIPNLAALARQFVISDRTFENDEDSTWVSHIQLVSAWYNGFPGKNPYKVPGNPHGPGWGCDSYMDVGWKPSSHDSNQRVPSCIPKADGTGPYKASPVPWVPTIFDRLEQAGVSYGIYIPLATEPGYWRSVCPNFADCLYGSGASHIISFDQFPADAQTGNLPAVSILIPDPDHSQHNQHPMLWGDTWIGDQLTPLMNGPDWSSSAVFIVYDDCGCFYDHVTPPKGNGIRMPMVIVSPYAKPGYTDSNDASFASMLAFVEHRYGLAPLSVDDAAAYDYSASLKYSQRPLGPVHMVRSKLPAWEERWLKAHPVDPEDWGES